ncbi:MAG: Crp/Fnr family transcriptional regulator [Ignavibacteriae bacterium]|nr:Crp/Fnr family transcriptional regulator [Ignavibacteriota bacterium]
MKTITESDKEFVCDINAVCFQNLSQEEAKLVSDSKTQVLFRKGENLTKQGAFASFVLFIVNGFVKQYVEDEGIKNFNLRIIKPGEFVGLSSVFTKESFNYSTSAITETLAILIEKEALEKIVKHNGLFGFNIIKRYCEQNAGLFELIKNIKFKQMHGNLAETILYIDSFKSDNKSLFSLLSRKDIADFAGTSTESAIKLLKSFEKDKLISLKEKDIIIKNRDKLVEISKKG